MKIEGKRLRELRSRKNWSQKVLASQIGVNEQTIYKAEKEGWSNPRPQTLARLKQVFGVSEEVLAGTAPLPAAPAGEEGDRDLETSYPTLRFRVSRETRNTYSLVALRYGVPGRMIADVAPVLFAIMAEQSLRQRSEALQKLEEGVSELEHTLDDAAKALPHLGSRGWVSYENNELIKAERRSIQQRDISARCTLAAIPDYEELPTDPEDNHLEPNPFSMFIRDTARAVGLDVDRHSDVSDEPVRIVLDDELKLIAGEDPGLRVALEQGWILIRDIPADLWKLQRECERIAWLRERLATDEYARERKELVDSFGKELDELGARKAEEGTPDA